MTKLLGLAAAALLATATPAAAQSPPPGPAGGAPAAVQTTAQVVARSVPAARASDTAGGAPQAAVAGVALSPNQRRRLPFTALDVAVLTLGSLLLVAMGFVVRRLGRPSGLTH